MAYYTVISSLTSTGTMESDSHPHEYRYWSQHTCSGPADAIRLHVAALPTDPFEDEELAALQSIVLEDSPVSLLPCGDSSTLWLWADCPHLGNRLTSYVVLTAIKAA